MNPETRTKVAAKKMACFRISVSISIRCACHVDFAAGSVNSERAGGARERYVARAGTDSGVAPSDLLDFDASAAGVSGDFACDVRRLDITAACFGIEAFHRVDFQIPRTRAEAKIGADVFSHDRSGTGRRRGCELQTRN